eukprot:EG_transcript_18145
MAPGGPLCTASYSYYANEGIAPSRQWAKALAFALGCVGGVLLLNLKDVAGTFAATSQPWQSSLSKATMTGMLTAATVVQPAFAVDQPVPLAATAELPAQTAAVMRPALPLLDSLRTAPSLLAAVAPKESKEAKVTMVEEDVPSPVRFFVFVNRVVCIIASLTAVCIAVAMAVDWLIRRGPFAPDDAATPLAVAAPPATPPPAIAAQKAEALSKPAALPTSSAMAAVAVEVAPAAEEPTP